MKYIVETDKSVSQAVNDLQDAVIKHEFGVLHILDLQQTMKNKGIDFPNECHILDVCNPLQANQVLSEDMDMNLALPCRISVYSDGDKTKIGMIKPRDLLSSLSDSTSLDNIAREVEQSMIAIIQAAK